MEAIGLSNAAFGPPVWERVHTFPCGGRLLEQHERFFVCRLEAHEPDARNQSQDERTYLIASRWWMADEIVETARRGVLFAPRRMGTLLPRVLNAPPPPTPLATGV